MNVMTRVVLRACSRALVRIFFAGIPLSAPRAGVNVRLAAPHYFLPAKKKCAPPLSWQEIRKLVSVFAVGVCFFPGHFAGGWGGIWVRFAIGKNLFRLFSDAGTLLVFEIRNVRSFSQM